MDGANLRETESLANSHDLERVYALNSALSGIDDDFESLEFKNQFVRKILDLLDDQTSTNYTTERIGIDFSSPNIAKPFHVGHLRSTFIGRAISNFLTSSGSDVIRINYLGDWGTQFGLLAAGYEINGNKIGGELTTGKLENLDSPRNRLRQYFEVYVMANELAEKDAAFRQKALDYCTRLENGQDENATQFWRRVVDESLEELKELYSRLYVKFDRWESENAASLPAKNLVKELEKRNLIECRNDGMIGIRLDGESRSQFVPLLKSDGTTLYLTRDIYSAITRFDQLACNKLIYVTDIRQEQHFRLLKQVLAKIGREDVADNITHVRFGRILNMSTRKGRAVFVTDLLDEAAGRAENQVLSTDPKTKTPSGTMERRMVAEQLSSTGLIINDLKKRLTLEYDFNWDHVLDTKKDGGVSLQQRFCRLCSIRDESDNSNVDFETFRRSIQEKEALKLVSHLSRGLVPTLKRSLDELELYPMTKYLFRLRKLSGSAVRRLRVLDAPTPALKSARFILFDVSRKVMGLGLSLLGAKPLGKI